MASHVRHAFWIACGSLVLLGILFAAVGAIELTGSTTVALLLLAALWLAHEWGALWRDEHRLH